MGWFDRDRRALITAPDFSKLRTLVSEHVSRGRASTTIGVFEPIRQKRGGTKAREPQHTNFLPPRPPQHCPRFFPRSFCPPRRLVVSKEHGQIEVGGSERQIIFLSTALTDHCVGWSTR